MKPITTTEAEARNLRPLTSACNSKELWIIENVCADTRSTFWQSFTAREGMSCYVLRQSPQRASQREHSTNGRRA